MEGGAPISAKHDNTMHPGSLATILSEILFEVNIFGVNMLMHRPPTINLKDCVYISSLSFLGSYRLVSIASS